MLAKTLESPLNSKEIKSINPKGNQACIFIGRTGAEAGAPILWPPDTNSQLTGKDPDAGKDWGQEEKGTREDEIVGWHHCLNGHEFEQAPGDCSSSCPLSQRCYLTISSSVALFSSCPQSFPASGSFPMSQFLTSGSQSIDCSFSFSISPSNEYSGLISFRIDWFDFFSVQGTLKSLLQQHSSKASILRHSAFFTIGLSNPYMTTGKIIALTRCNFVGKVSAF